MRLHIAIPILLAIGTLAIGLVEGSTTLYVSTTGSKRADGTKQKPHTLQEALSISKADEIQEIVLFDGTYELVQPINLSLTRESRNPLKIRALNPGRARLSGGLELKNPIQNSNGHHEFLKSDYPSLLKSRDLYVGETRATRARSITYSSWDEKFSAVPGLSKIDTATFDSQIKVEPGFSILDHTGQCPPLSSWESPSDIEVVFRCAWWEKRCRVDSASENQLNFTQPAWTIINTPWASEQTSRLNAQMPKKTIFEGAIELLDSPGEWHYGTSKISLIPPPNYNPENDAIRLGQLETIMRLENASGIHFEGIQFSHTTWNLPIGSTGFNEGQANFEQIGETGHPTESVGIYNSSNIVFENCSFTQLGGWGVGIFDTSSNVRIDNCAFIDTAGSAIVVGSIEKEAALSIDNQVTDIKITNTWIHKPASIYKGGVGIFVGYASNVSIVNNEVCHAPYTGISIGWGWNQFDNQTTEIHGNTVSGNYIHHYLYEMYDGGAIYTLGPQSNDKWGMKRGLSISRNIVHNQGGIGNILYSDGGSSWITLEGNQTYNNLKELEAYYEWKAMYVPDWGGCSPYGNLLFTGNELGNYEDKSPNFRCAPTDPEPWNPAFRLPHNTRFEENRFESKTPIASDRSLKSKQSHERVGDRPTNGIQSFSTSIKNTNQASVLFSLSESSDISIESTSSAFPLTTTLFRGSELVSSWQDKTSIQSLPSGTYQLTFPESSGGTSLPEAVNVSVASQLGSIYLIEATSSEIQFSTSNDSIQRYLGSVAGEQAQTIDLATSKGLILETAKSWIDHPFHWQTLRAVIDAGLGLPKHNSRVGLYDLPSGSFRLGSPQSKGTVKTTVVAVSKHNL